MENIEFTDQQIFNYFDGQISKRERKLINLKITNDEIFRDKIIGFGYLYRDIKKEHGYITLAMIQNTIKAHTECIESKFALSHLLNKNKKLGN